MLLDKLQLLGGVRIDAESCYRYLYTICFLALMRPYQANVFLQDTAQSLNKHLGGKMHGEHRQTVIFCSKKRSIIAQSARFQ